MPVNRAHSAENTIAVVLSFHAFVHVGVLYSSSDLTTQPLHSCQMLSHSFGQISLDLV